MALKGRLKTADVHLSKGIIVNALCPLCHSSAKIVMYLFFVCDYSFTVIAKLILILRTLKFVRDVKPL
ncbi:hypothetical protein MA16_Dca026643 [Dendrobium catenatum]|uniref:Reverse transcriptase zinc-binding domain-containing protein n=1 Tax=Dendrobium catenatum TaxID=906689 RepID=A0A2I0V798_9ASPA|nr:hypothetical protein MA16_Dca026643 [Dendrobium catenatum]